MVWHKRQISARGNSIPLCPARGAWTLTTAMDSEVTCKRCLKINAESMTASDAAAKELNAMIVRMCSRDVN